MPNSGYWNFGDQATEDLMNGMLAQYGVAASRPAATQQGRDFYATDTLVVSRDNGASWDEIYQVDPAAAIAGLHTLGSGPTQAATGNHTHT